MFDSSVRLFVSCRDVLLLSALFAGGGFMPAQMTESGTNATGTVKLKVSRPMQPHVIPSTVFGSFLEPIGHSTYGGLWADVVENPSFEEGLWSAGNEEAMLRSRPELHRASQLGLPLPWEPLDQAQGSRYAVVRGEAANSSQSLLVMSLPGKEVGVLQQVYLPAERELSYAGSVWVKHLAGPSTLVVSLRRHGHPEQVLASATIEAAGAEWAKYPFALKLEPHQIARLEPADLVLSVANDGRLQIDNVSLHPSDSIDGMDPDVIAMARDLHSPLVRFGGNFTSAYDWRDGVGPADKRVSMRNLSWGIPEYNTFGTDEFLRFCELIHAQPQIALNLGTGKPEEAAQWVKYVNEHWADRRGGILWELGNELWGDFQIGYPSEQRIGAVTLAASEAVLREDPKARLIATGGDEDHFITWNAEQLKNPVGSFQYLSTHFVVNDSVQLPHSSNDFRSMAALALPWGLADRLRSIKLQAATSPHKDVNVAFTEWLMISNGRSGLNYTNLGGALFASGFLNMMMRNSDIVPISDMTGILEFGGIWKKKGQVYGAPAYWVLREYASHYPHLLLEVQSDGPTYSISQGVSRLPEIKDVPYLDVVAAESQDRTKLLLLCLNRNLTRPIAASIDLSAIRVKKGTASTVTIAGENILTENDEETPNRVVSVTHVMSVGSNFDYTFPSGSVTIIEVPLVK